jgi:hypothetical protein
MEATAGANATDASTHERMTLCEQPRPPPCHPRRIARRSDTHAAASCGRAARPPRGAPPERPLAGGQRLEAAAGSHDNDASTHEQLTLSDVSIADLNAIAAVSRLIGPSLYAVVAPQARTP